jgi:hypothetical protein
MIEFSDEVKYQLDFFTKQPFIVPFAEFSNQKVLIDKIQYASKHYDKFFLLNREEAFGNEGWFGMMQSELNKYDNEIYISASTSSKIYRGFNPLVNICMWGTTFTRNTIDWSADDIPLFEPHYFNNIKKSNKGILSVRRETDDRNYLFSKLNFDSFEGILRYAKWPMWDYDETENHKFMSKNKFPTQLELFDEYKKSYVSFVYESFISSWNNSLTEKTLMAFFTKTMPVLFGGYNFLNELNDMGFYTFNHEFDFLDEYDYLGMTHNAKSDLFLRAINSYNKKSLNEIQDIYNRNISKIEHNYKLVSELLKYKLNPKNEIIL